MREKRKALETRLTEKFYSNKDLLPLDRMPEGDLYSLLLIKHGTDEGTEMANLVNQDYASRYNFKQQISWSHNELWVRVQDPVEANTIKPKLRELGYSLLETFMGNIGNGDKRHWVLKGKQTPGYLQDGNGWSKKLKHLLEGMGLEPKYVMALPHNIMAEFEITVETLVQIQYFQKMNDKYNTLRTRLVRNPVNAIDIVKMVFNDDSDHYVEVSIPELLDQLATFQAQ